MKLSHVLLKVSDLDEAVEKYRSEGFHVEYGRAEKPYNALIYFADRSYLELLWKTGMPRSAIGLLRLLGKKAFASRISTWDSAAEGLIGLALESEQEELEDAKPMLRGAGHGYFQFKAKRPDTRGRVLRFVGVMPDDMHLPFFGLCKSDLSEDGLVHPNGVIGFKQVAFGTTEHLLPIIERLCDDDRLKTIIGSGVKDLEFLYAEH